MVLARTIAIGTPKSTHSRVLTLEVRRLSSSASTDESEVIRPKKLLHSTRVRIATSGSTTNSAPTAAGTKTHVGSPT